MQNKRFRTTWAIILVPTTPLCFQSSTTTDTTMGAIGLAVTGGVFYNQLSSTDGSLALTNEGTSLDSCFGHSDLVKKKNLHWYTYQNKCKALLKILGNFINETKNIFWLAMFYVSSSQNIFILTLLNISTQNFFE